MEWWQTLIVGTAPALVAVGALFVQQWLTGKDGARTATIDRVSRIAEKHMDRLTDLTEESVVYLGTQQTHISPSVSCALDRAQGRDSHTSEEPAFRLVEASMIHSRLVLHVSPQAAEAFWDAVNAMESTYLLADSTVVRDDRDRVLELRNSLVASRKAREAFVAWAQRDLRSLLDLSANPLTARSKHPDDQKSEQ